VATPADTPIVEFIEHARTKGMDHATIRMLLLSTGWKEKDIARAMTEQSLEMPVPTPPDIGGAREAFLHLVVFAALYTAVGSGLSLLFSLINLALPDPAVTAYATRQLVEMREVMRWEIAAMVVSVPVLVWLSSLLVREVSAAPDRARSPIRRWLTYLTLFVAALTIGVDVMTLLAALLGGELSLRFVLKVLAVLAAAGAGFAYYFITLRAQPGATGHTAMHRWYGWGTAAAGVALVGVGLLTLGMPGLERARQFDARRVEDLRLIYGEVMRQTNGAAWSNPTIPVTHVAPLPTSLEEVAQRAVAVTPRILDPETGLPYEYTVLNETMFSVCAVFSDARDEVSDVAWNHPGGHHCYTFDTKEPRR
jgi:hypothetical protein